MIGRLAILASLLAEGLIFGTLAELLAASYERSDPHAVSAWAFCVVAVAGYGIPRLVEGFELSPRRGYALTGILGVLVIYALLRITLFGDIAVWQIGWIGDFLSDAQSTAEEGGHAIMGGILLIATWARATLRSADEIEMESIPRSVAVPFALVTTFVVLGAATDRSGEVGRVGAAFYVMAILSLVCSQLAMSGATFGELRAGSTAAILLAGTGVLAVVGLLFIALVTSVLGPYIGPVISKATQVTLTIILTPFAWVLTRIFEALFAGANPFPNITQNAAEVSREAGNPDEANPSAASKASLFLMRTVALLVMLAVVALLMTVFVRLRKRSADRLVDGREASAIGDLRTDLGSMYRSLLGRRKPREPGEASTEATRLYLEVLAKAEQSGHGRPTGETAREFAPVLNQTFATPVTDDITKAFEAARYAGREPDARTIEELRRRWHDKSS
jgi:hypothetical protein